MDQPVLISDWIPRASFLSTNGVLRPVALRPPRRQAEVDRDWERVGGRPGSVVATRFVSVRIGGALRPSDDGDSEAIRSVGA